MARRILVIGSGGREHALAWRLQCDSSAPDVWVAPGNDGMRSPLRRLAIAESDAPALAAACAREEIDLVVVGPEGPLAAGVADALEAAGRTVFGASAAAARLESSKWFAKEIMREAGVPTADAERFDALGPALAALERRPPPYVIKADGLAAGKGVCVTESAEEARAFLADCLERGRFGASGRSVVVETFLEGEEASVMAVCDGRRHVLLPAARDYKRAGDGDRGANTGGMGACAPAPLVDAALESRVSDRIIAPVLRALERRGTPLRGVLYAGLMVHEGEARVLEFNVRFGDPETQAVLPLVDGAFAALLESAARGELASASVTRNADAAVAVALVDEAYPGRGAGEAVIEGLDALEGRRRLHVFHAATVRAPDGWHVRGGRGAYVVARDGALARARERVYAAVGSLGGRGWRFRRDIAADLGAVAHAPGLQGGV